MAIIYFLYLSRMILWFQHFPIFIFLPQQSWKSCQYTSKNFLPRLVFLHFQLHMSFHHVKHKNILFCFLHSVFTLSLLAWKIWNFGLKKKYRNTWLVLVAIFLPIFLLLTNKVLFFLFKRPFKDSFAGLSPSPSH